jgi:hypothetical protein
MQSFVLCFAAVSTEQHTVMNVAVVSLDAFPKAAEAVPFFGSTPRLKDSQPALNSHDSQACTQTG